MPDPQPTATASQSQASTSQPPVADTVSNNPNGPGTPRAMPPLAPVPPAAASSANPLPAVAPAGLLDGYASLPGIHDRLFATQPLPGAGGAGSAAGTGPVTGPVTGPGASAGGPRPASPSVAPQAGLAQAFVSVTDDKAVRVVPSEPVQPAALPPASPAQPATTAQAQPNWTDPTTFAGRLHGLTGKALGRRLQQSQALIDENAIISPAWAHQSQSPTPAQAASGTAGLLAASHTSSGRWTTQMRPWPLDVVPFYLSEQEDAYLHKALAQRAQLLEWLLQDLLGPQTVIQNGWVPAALLHANKRFHRAYQELAQSPGQPLAKLTLYAADVSQGDDGQWWVTGDRTQAPSGLGFALENRMAAARAHPDLFWPLQIQRLADFFITLRDQLTAMVGTTVVPETAAGAANAQPPSTPASLPGLAMHDAGGVVILSEDFQAGHRGFEDAYLARYLGLTRVEGGDLAVRKGQATIKTLGGAKPVSVIFRRINDENCDPVELNGHSIQGVAGLVEAMRQNAVRLVNPLGSQLVEAPVWMAFLPGLSEKVLGEKLLLPSLATWWCGQSHARRHVLKHLDDLNIYPAFRTGAQPIDTRSMSDEQRQALVDDIRQRPEQYIGQERLRRSTTPVWEKNQAKPWHWSMRRFLVAKPGEGQSQRQTQGQVQGQTQAIDQGLHTNGKSKKGHTAFPPANQAFASLPGGLVRVSPDQAMLDDASSASVKVQDCWVPASSPPSSATLLPPAEQPLPIQRVGAELPSRVADNLYWLGRMIEQCEQATRMLRLVLAQTTGDDDWRQQVDVGLIVRWMVDRQQLGPSVLQGLDQPEADHGGGLARALAQDALAPGRPDNWRGLVQETMRLAQLVRDRLALDAWRLLTRLDRFIAHSAHRPGGVDATDVLSMTNHAVMELVALGGLMSESMTRTLGWRFMDIGRRLQRAQWTTDLLAHCLIEPKPQEPAVLSALLEACDGTMTYQARYRAAMQVPAVLDLLVTDDTNPRSIAHQVNVLSDHVQHLPIDATLTGPLVHQRVMQRLNDGLCVADPMALAERLQAVTGAPNLGTQGVGGNVAAANKPGPQREALKRLLDGLGKQWPLLDQALSSRYLIHAGLPKQFVDREGQAGWEKGGQA